MNTIYNKGARCPRCGKDNDSATAAVRPDVRPKPNDISICLYCQAISVFDEHFGLREPTPEEWVELTVRKDIIELQISLANLNIK